MWLSSLKRRRKWLLERAGWLFGCGSGAQPTDSSSCVTMETASKSAEVFPSLSWQQTSAWHSFLLRLRHAWASGRSWWVSCGADKALISGQICAVSWLSLCLHVELAALFLDQHKKGDKLREKTTRGERTAWLWSCTGKMMAFFRRFLLRWWWRRFLKSSVMVEIWWLSRPFCTNSYMYKTVQWIFCLVEGGRVILGQTTPIRRVSGL